MRGKLSSIPVLSFLVVAMLLAGCGRDGDGPAVTAASSKLLVIGIDAADWSLLDPMIAEGRLPRLAAFRAQSSSGRMRTFVPLEKSPLLWASICTGVGPEVHGVASFLKESDRKSPVGSAWYAPAIWDMIGAAGQSTAVIGMWTTYPARPINGVMVSDYLPYGRERSVPLARLVYPDSLSARVVACRVDPDSLQARDLVRFLPPGADVAALEAAYPREMRNLREFWAADLGYLNVARMLKDVADFDLFFFYLRGPDMMSHSFYHYLKDDPASPRNDPQELAAFGDIVRRYYDWVDEAVGEVLSWFPADRPAVILSDHGFHGPRPSGRGTVEHSEWGIFMVRSPLHQAGQSFDRLELLDVCPTFLSLLGLPPAGDMPGVILTGGLTEAGRRYVKRLEKHRVPSYMELRPVEGADVGDDPAVGEEIRKQLRSLGYIN
ncbi:MAG: alkaline phosphatase family protein [Candidatus Latescibacteria bacterium]|nr:alkaline phosphatase family protein [Candidatus Latescibacterota bacterium]